MDTIERLRAERDRVCEQRDALERRIDEIDAAIYEAQGDVLAAEWHRLKAAKDPGEHAAWVRIGAGGAGALAVWGALSSA
jgi:hypothetical protein